MMKRTKGGSWIIENGKIFDSEIGAWETLTWENNPYEIIKREKAEQKEPLMQTKHSQEKLTNL
jgi:hypothetical protein